MLFLFKLGHKFTDLLALFFDGREGKLGRKFLQFSGLILEGQHLMGGLSHVASKYGIAFGFVSLMWFSMRCMTAGAIAQRPSLSSSAGKFPASPSPSRNMIALAFTPGIRFRCATTLLASSFSSVSSATCSGVRIDSAVGALLGRGSATACSGDSELASSPHLRVAS